MTLAIEKSLKSKRRGMLRRCYDPKHKDYRLYGAKGIYVCDEWKNRKTGNKAFIEWAINNGYEAGLTIERRDTSQGYCPENCCFVPMKDQAKNTSRNVYIEYHGEVLYASEVARRENVSAEAIRKRIKHGWYRVVDKSKVEATPTPAH